MTTRRTLALNLVALAACTLIGVCAILLIRMKVVS